MADYTSSSDGQHQPAYLSIAHLGESHHLLPPHNHHRADTTQQRTGNTHQQRGKQQQATLIPRSLLAHEADGGKPPLANKQENSSRDDADVHATDKVEPRNTNDYSPYWAIRVGEAKTPGPSHHEQQHKAIHTADGCRSYSDEGLSLNKLCRHGHSDCQPTSKGCPWQGNCGWYPKCIEGRAGQRQSDYRCRFCGYLNEAAQQNSCHSSQYSKASNPWTTPWGGNLSGYNFGFDLYAQQCCHVDQAQPSNEVDHTPFKGQRVGEASHPGPAAATYQVMCANVSNLEGYGHKLKQQKVDFIFGQEHSTPGHKKRQVISSLRPWAMHLSQLDAECEQPTGGVFLLQKTRLQPLTPKPMGRKLKQLNGAGRIQLYAMQMGNEVTFLVYNFYGWTNGNHSKEAAARTNSMVEAALEDMALQPPGPRFLLGDLNGDPATFPALQQALDTNLLLDVGAQAHAWGEVTNDYTCRAQGAKQPTRRDYIFATPAAHTYITHFHVNHSEAFDVHDPIHLELTIQATHRQTYQALKRPMSLNSLCIRHMIERYGQPKLPNSYDNQHFNPSATTATTVPTATTTTAGTTDPFQHLAKDTISTKLWADIGDLDPDTAHEDDSASTKRAHFTQQQQEDYQAEVHAAIDEQLCSQGKNMEADLAARDHDKLLQRWASAIEQGIFQQVKADAAAIRKHCGHGCVEIQRRRQPTTGYIPHGSDRMQNDNKHNMEFHRLQQQCSRLGAIKAHIWLLGEHHDRQELGQGNQLLPGIRRSSSIISLAEAIPKAGSNVARGNGNLNTGVAGIGVAHAQAAETPSTSTADPNHSDHTCTNQSTTSPTPPASPTITEPPTWVERATRAMEAQVKAYCRQIDDKNKGETDTRQALQSEHTSWRKLHAQLSRHHQQHQDHISTLSKALAKQANQATAERLQGHHGQSIINRVVKQQHTQPMQAIQRPPDPATPNQPGTYTTEPGEIDSIIQAAWDPIYNGNTTNIQQLVDNFFLKYHTHIYQAPPTTVPDITWEEIKFACTHGNSSAPGMDGWTKLDLSWLSDKAFQWLATCFKSIETTHKWPTSMTKARAVFLSKDAEDMGNPMAYRILKITSTLYRLWGSIRIQHLEQWISTWADPAMFAGVSGAGAEEGWYLTQLELELKQATGGEVTAASIDVYKCFDQIVRPLVVALARAAGMPTNILLTYEAFQEALIIHNQLGHVIGQPHKHRCSIPQGCPFSMALVALLMRPWISTMRDNNLEPRVLADDLFLHASRHKHASTMVHGMNLSRQYFADLGARVADKKCFVTSTCPATRARLRSIRWAPTRAPITTSTPTRAPAQPSNPQPINGQGSLAGATIVSLPEPLVSGGRSAKATEITITVVNHFRDLGAHVCLDHTNTNTTIANRLRRATQWVKRLRGLPITHAQKLTTIRSMILPAALYGAEVGHCPKAELQALETAIANAVGPRSNRRSVPLTMEMCSTSGEIDPRVHLLVRKITLLLRILAKFPHSKTKVQALLCAYHTQHRQGTTAWQGMKGEDQHTHNFGPISHLLVELHNMGATIGTDFVVTQAEEAPLPLLCTPWQYIRILTEAIGQRARYRMCHQSRSHTINTTLLDHQALQRALRRQTPADKAILRYIGTGAAWAQGHLSHISPHTSNRCKLCGQEELTIDHGLWHCMPVRSTAKAIREMQHQDWKQQQKANKEEEEHKWIQKMLHSSDPRPNTTHPDDHHTTSGNSQATHCSTNELADQADGRLTTGNAGTGIAAQVPNTQDAQQAQQQMADAQDLVEEEDPFGHCAAGLDEATPNSPTHRQGDVMGNRVDGSLTTGYAGSGVSQPPPSLQQHKGSDNQQREQTQKQIPPDHHTNFPSAKQPQQATHLFDINPDDLPLSLRFGLPPDMGNRLKGTFWSSSPQQTQTSQHSARQRLGIRDATKRQRDIATEQDEEGQQQLARHQLAHLTARQAFQVLRGQHPPTPNIALPAPCTQPPPPQPNVYSDGSLTSPTEPLYSLGGAGAWHPNRQLHVTGTSEAEANMAIVSQEAAGLKLFTQMNGYGGSSTRLEIAGAIIGMAADGAMHLGTDSSSFLTKTHTIHNHIRQHTLPKRPWALQRDGDMWHMYYKHAAAKKPDAITITKVKGHATQEMVNEGKVRPADKDGNDKADEAADEGVELFTQPVVRLSKQFAKRHTAYSHLVGDIHEHLAFVYKVRAVLLQKAEQHTKPHAPAKAHHTPMTTISQPPFRGDPTTHCPPQRFTQLLQVQQCPQLCKRLPAVMQVQAFLRDVPYTEVDHTEGKQDHTHGFTWLELYGLYRLAGYPEPLPYHRHDAATRPTLRQQLHNFRLATRQLAISTMAVEHHRLFKGMQAKHEKRLSSIGINTNVAILPWQPCLTQEAQKRLAQEILRSQYRLSPIQAERALQEQRQMATRQIQLKGRTRWSGSIKPLTKPLYQSHEQSKSSEQHPTATSSTATNEQHRHNQCTPTSKEDVSRVDGSLITGDAGAGVQHLAVSTNLPTLIYFKCPRCPHRLPGIRAAFQSHNLDTRLWCNSCRKSLFVKQWQCSCGIPWHVCPHHQAEPDRLRGLQQQQSTPHTTTTTPTPPRSRPKRLLGQGKDEQIQRWLDQPPVKKARATPVEIELEDISPNDQRSPAEKRVNPHLLGPKLLAKFPRLAMEARQEGQAEQQATPRAEQPPIPNTSQSSQPRAATAHVHPQGSTNDPPSPTGHLTVPVVHMSTAPGAEPFSKITEPTAPAVQHYPAAETLPLQHCSTCSSSSSSSA